MSDTKTPRLLIAIAVLALAGAMLLAGCGGSGGTTATDQGPPPGSNAPEAIGEAETEGAPSEEGGPAEAPEEASAEETEEAPAGETEEAPAEEAAGGEEAGGESAMVAEGKTVFTTNCGSCHTLAEAGTSGTIGPNLDELKPSEETVEHQVINGGGPMPAFGNEGILKPDEIKAVATYVSTVAGTE